MAQINEENELLDIAYHSMFDKEDEHLILEANDTDNILMDTYEEKMFIRYQRKIGNTYATSYDETTHVFATKDQSILYRFSQNSEKLVKLYQMGDPLSDEGVEIVSGKIDYTVEPLAAFIEANKMFIALNMPVEQSLDKPFKETRKFSIQRPGGQLENIPLAYGFLCIISIDLIGNDWKAVFETSENLSGYGISSAADEEGSLGFAIMNQTETQPISKKHPRSFKTLLDALEQAEQEPLAPPKDIPYGVSVYDIGNAIFERLPMNGEKTRWGILKKE